MAASKAFRASLVICIATLASCNSSRTEQPSPSAAETLAPEEPDATATLLAVLATRYSDRECVDRAIVGLDEPTLRTLVEYFDGKPDQGLDITAPVSDAIVALSDCS